jgi:hypothetical protein
VVEVSAIVGTGLRTGVDMVWGGGAVYGHFGIDITGPNGGVVRIDDIAIEDVTGAFLRKMMDWVDVRDFGAVGDGVTDDRAAFAAADAAAAGRQVYVPAGTYRIGSNLTLENEARFEGTVTMPAAARLILRRNFHLNGYIDAFGNEVEAFRRGFQALLHFSDHESSRPLRAPDRDRRAARHARRGGHARHLRGAARGAQRPDQLHGRPGWTTGTATSQASYAASNPLTLTNVANVANVEVGSLVTGTGVGREVYVTAKNVPAGTITLSQQLWGAPASQTYTFRRFRYALDFSGFAQLSRLVLDDLDIQCNGLASGILLAPAGSIVQIRDCWITRPRDRGITSHGTGCQDLQVDRCQMISNEQAIAATARTSVGLNVNANDAKIRDSRFQRMGTTMVLKGNGHLIVGNHWFQGDEVTDGPRVAGLVFTETNVKSVVTGNYIDNCFIEWTNEHDATPALRNRVLLRRPHRHRQHLHRERRGAVVLVDRGEALRAGALPPGLQRHGQRLQVAERHGGPGGAGGCLHRRARLQPDAQRRVRGQHLQRDRPEHDQPRDARVQPGDGGNHLDLRRLGLPPLRRLVARGDGGRDGEPGDERRQRALFAFPFVTTLDGPERATASASPGPNPPRAASM